MAWVGKMSVIGFIGVAIAVSKRTREIDFDKMSWGQALAFGSVAGLAIGLVGAVLYTLILLPVRPRDIKQPGHLDKYVEPASVSFAVGTPAQSLEFKLANEQYAGRFQQANPAAA